MTQRNSLDATFALSADVTLPGGLVSLPFDALLIAEGEWSNSCNRLGIDKAVNVFSQAIGLIINMNYDAKDAAERQLRDRVVRPNDDGEHKRIVDDLKKAGVDFEFIEYLKGETHYIVVTITKASLLGLGALRADLPRERLLERSNVDEEKLLGAARTVATIFGLPAESSFCDFHPVKLFDFSSRAKALCGYKVLGVCTGGSQQGQVSVPAITRRAEALVDLGGGGAIFAKSIAPPLLRFRVSTSRRTMSLESQRRPILSEPCRSCARPRWSCRRRPTTTAGVGSPSARVWPSSSDCTRRARTLRRWRRPSAPSRSAWKSREASPRWFPYFPWAIRCSSRSGRKGSARIAGSTPRSMLLGRCTCCLCRVCRLRSSSGILLTT